MFTGNKHRRDLIRKTIRRSESQDPCGFQEAPEFKRRAGWTGIISRSCRGMPVHRVNPTLGHLIRGFTSMSASTSINVYEAGELTGGGAQPC